MKGRRFIPIDPLCRNEIFLPGLNFVSLIFVVLTAAFSIWGLLTGQAYPFFCAVVSGWYGGYTFGSTWVADDDETDEPDLDLDLAA